MYVYILVYKKRKKVCFIKQSVTGLMRINKMCVHIGKKLILNFYTKIY